MIGTYKFYQNGKLVAAEKNLLTTNGKTAIMKYMAGYSGHFGRSIRLGIGATAAAASDTALNFESMATQVYLISPDYANTLLVFKGRVDDTAAGIIYEAGLSTMIPDNSSNGSRMLLAFDSGIDAWSAGTWQTGARIGGDALRLAPAVSASATATLTDMFLDLSDYSNSDQFKLAYTPSTNVASVFIRFYTDASNYYTYTINTPTSGFKIQTFAKSDAVATGTPSWANITQVMVSATATSGGAATVDFEGLRVDDKDTYTDNDVLVSRAVLGSPVTKVSGVPLDVEYTLDLTL